MNIFDEHIPVEQRQLLSRWHLPIRHIGYDIGRKGMKDGESASFARRFSRHPEFNTQTKRMGVIARISRKGLWVWRLHIEKEAQFSWPGS